MLHPTVRLIVWAVAVACAQWLPLIWLSLACAAALIAGVWLAPERLGLLLKRTRWLLLSLVLLFALATPGVYLLPFLGSLGPTEEGLRLGFAHLMRLLFVLASLAVLLRFTGMDGLVAGLHGLLRPFVCLGLDRARVAVRLMLVMHYVEHFPPGRRWREWLQDDAAPDEPVSFHLQTSAWGRADFAVLAGLAVMVAAALVIGAAA
ncbi:MAG: energy-coupling factor transporter transmembrane protein EcfT [Zoogloeaceae bacterium]|jgi:energy-coupling factor transport system permease protein|nr:energy-coupling factor transporter transmembrane protein EcfT [Zoogloeaceae bacterium]